MKKILILGLAVLLTLSLLAACGGNSGNNTPSGDSNADNSSAPASDSGSSGTNSKGNSAEKGALPPDTKVIKVGATQKASDITVTLDEVWVSTYVRKPGKLPAGHVFLFPHFTITNMNEIYKGITHPSINRLTFTTSTGCVAYIGDEKYKFDLNALLSYAGEATQMDTYVDYGETLTVFNGFIVPENWETVELVVNQLNDHSGRIEQLNFRYVVVNK